MRTRIAVHHRGIEFSGRHCCRRPRRLDHFTVEAPAVAPLIRLRHRCDGGKLASHRVMTESALNNSGCVVGPRVPAVLALEQFNLLVQQVLR